MRKIITFLGVYPKQTEYQYHGEVYQGRVFAEAMHQFLDYDRMLVFVTDEARSSAFPVLEALQDERILAIRIPTGESTEEMWEIFEALTNAVEEHDQVIFDITHGLRSLPFLVFLAAAFLKSAKQVQIEAIYYGAFELQKDQQGNPRPAPVIELSEFVGLLDWTTATYLFLQTGIAAPLAERLRQANWSFEVRAEALEEVTAAMRLTRPDEARSLAYQFSQALSTLHLASPAAKPFELLLDRVRDEFARIAPRSPQPDDLEQELREEYALIQWNFNRGQFLSAITVAREWLVSLLCWHWTIGVTDKNSGQEVPAWRSEGVRKKGEKALNHLKDLATLDEAERAKQIGSKTPIAQELWKRNAAYAEQLGSAWGLASSLRNDLNHAGKVHSTAPRSLRDILHEIECTRRTLTDLFIASGLESHPTPTF